MRMAELQFAAAATTTRRRGIAAVSTCSATCPRPPEQAVARRGSSPCRPRCRGAAVVDEEGHRQSRRVDRLGLQGLGDVERPACRPDVEFLEAGDARCRRLPPRRSASLDAAEGQDARYAPVRKGCRGGRGTWNRRIGLIEPEKMRPVTTAAKIRIGFQHVPAMRKRPRSLSAAHVLSTRSNKGPHVFLGASGESAIQPCLADP